jgi:NhaP-type Na+/H+ or K+/H+ antiporter
MLGTRAQLPTVGFLGWFGPRGLASIVFALIIVEESQLPQQNMIVLVAYLTVGLSVFAHGISAAPLASRYARWFERTSGSRPSRMESTAAEVSRSRGPGNTT